MQQINEQVVKAIPAKNEIAEALFTLWATRERNAREGRSTLDETRRQLKKEGYIVVPSELLSIFKELQRAGAGTLRGKIFTWGAVGLREVAKLAFDQKSVPVVETEQAYGGVTATERTYKVVVAYLSNDRKVKMELPADLSPKEAQFLSGLLDGRG